MSGDHLSMEFPRRPIETRLLAEARYQAKESDTMHDKHTKDELEEDKRTSAVKVARSICQARLGVHLRRRYAWKLWRLSRGGNKSGIRHMVPKNMTLEKDTKANVITLTGIEIFPKVGEQGGETIVGTLDVHVNGFLYATSSPDFHFHFFCTDIKETFFRDGDEKVPTLLHFHMRQPVQVGSEMRQDIQFRMVQTPVGQKTSYNDPETQTRDREDLKNPDHKVEGGAEIHKRNEFQGNLPSKAPTFCGPSLSEKQTMDGEKLQGFLCETEEKLSRYSFGAFEVDKSCEFQGNLPFKAPTVFGLTFAALVGLVDEPLFVVIVDKIEIVSLRLKPPVIDMTIVFRDFKRDLVHINSIPIAALDLIKDCYNFAKVKYYETYEDIIWGRVVEMFADSREDFFYWAQSCLEDPHTASCYNYYENLDVQAFCEGEDEGEADCGSAGEAYLDQKVQHVDQKEKQVKHTVDQWW